VRIEKWLLVKDGKFSSSSSHSSSQSLIKMTIKELVPTKRMEGVHRIWEVERKGLMENGQTGEVWFVVPSV
jgi:hypothetical protein